MSQVRGFLLLGALTTLIDYALYALLILWDVDYVAAVVLGYSAGLWANYALGRRYVFRAGSKLESSRKEFVAVAVIAVGGVLINILAVKLLSHDLFTFDPLFSRIIGIGAGFVWNYGMRKRYVYH
ncbi:MAG: GtrA family protein [Campylobacterales bacterium]|nr:GtrA family protein [Campylobacterales bacterium]